MRYALQKCCTTPGLLSQYDQSVHALLEALGVELVDVEGFNCCGYPLKNCSHDTYLLLSGRNHALAQRAGLPIMTFCNCCYANLRHARHILHKEASLLDKVNAKLEREGLRFSEGVGVKHLIEVLYRDIGVDRIRERVTRPLHGVKIAVHYGCHLLRPRDLVHLDAPGTAAVFDALVTVTGAEVLAWKAQDDCCGSPLWGVNDDLALAMTERKIGSALDAGADFLCTACPYCQFQFDRVQKRFLNDLPARIPSILYTQLLGLCVGVKPDALGIARNEVPAHEILQV